jgi:(p)ppGpp synthase/HD superfamily hydrolase
VAAWVGEVTEPDKSKPWKARKQAYLTALAAADYEVLMISLADKRDNLRSLVTAIHHQGQSVWGKFTSPKPDQQWYYQELLAVYSERILQDAGRRMLEALQKDFRRLFDQ